MGCRSSRGTWRKTRPPGRSWSRGPGVWPCRSSQSTERWWSGSTGAGSSGSWASECEPGALPRLRGRPVRPARHAAGRSGRLPELRRACPSGEGHRHGLDGESRAPGELPRLRDGDPAAGGRAGRGRPRALRAKIPAHLGVRSVCRRARGPGRTLTVGLPHRDLRGVGSRSPSRCRGPFTRAGAARTRGSAAAGRSTAAAARGRRRRSGRWACVPRRPSGRAGRWRVAPSRS